MQVMGPPIGAPLHLLAFSGTTAAAAGYQQLPAIQDPVFSRVGNNFQNPYNLGAWGGYVMSTSIIRARLNTASLRLRGFPQVRPVVAGVAVPTDPNWMDMTEKPIYLRPDEDIEVDVDVGANAEVATAFLWVTYAASQAPTLNGNVNNIDLRWIRATAAITSLTNLWSGPNAITLEDVIEGGSYNVYGAECYGTATCAFRLWFQNQYWKPGGLGFATVGLRAPLPFYEMRPGLWGNFNTYSLPQLEVFDSNGAATTKTLFMLIGKSSQEFRGQQN